MNKPVSGLNIIVSVVATMQVSPRMVVFFQCHSNFSAAASAILRVKSSLIAFSPEQSSSAPVPITETSSPLSTTVVFFHSGGMVDQGQIPASATH